MATEATFDAFSAGGDKDDLIPTDDKPVFGKGGHILASSGSFTSEGSHKGESSPLHKLQKKISSGKDVSQSHGLKIIITCAVSFAVIITLALILSIVFGEPEVGGNAGVAADVPICSDMGVDILKQGGNAIDAMVTTMLCVGVVDAQSSGIGGGGFMLIHDHKTHKSKVYDFRETAPASADSSMYSSNPEQRLVGGKSVGIPGELRGMQAAHNKFGRLSWKSVVKPAADLARNGFKVTESMASVFDKGKVDITEFTGLLRETYASGGEFVRAGIEIKRPELADTLDLIAEEGADAFYTGRIAQSIVQAVNSHLKSPGNITLKDLRDYRVIERDAIRSTYNGHTLLSVPVPASGPVLLSVLNVLEGFQFKPADFSKPETYHYIIEAMKMVYPEQQMLGDPKYDRTGGVKNVTKRLLDKKESEKMKELLRNITIVTDETGTSNGEDFKPLDHGTSHISIIDTQEVMVTVTTTINRWFGSRVMTDTGILLNDEMADFFVPKSGSESRNQVNMIEPGKRPMSNMSPLVLVNEDKPCSLRLVIGAANGSRIISGIVQTLLNVVSFAGPSMTLEKAVNSPRIHYDPQHRDTEYEHDFPKEIVDELTKMGHVMHEVTEGINIVQAVMKVNNTVQAVSDKRKWGRAATLLPKNP